MWYVVVPSWKQRFSVDWRRLVEERITNLCLNTRRFEWFFLVLIFFSFWVFANQLTVHSGGVSSEGGSVTVVVSVRDRGHIHNR